MYPEVTLAQARELTLEARALLKVGQDPVTERKATKARAVESAAVTFEGVAKEWMESRADKWARTNAEKVEVILENNLFPRIGALPITSITAPMLLGALRLIEAREALEMAARARRWAGEVFRYAIATGRWHRRPSYRAQGRSQSRADRTLSSSPLFLGGHKRVPYMSENTLNKAIEVIGYKGRVVGHGFRATASTILNESGQFAPDVIERQLAHAERNKVGAAYHRAEYLAERTKLMQFWANELDRLVLGAEVVQLPQRA